MKKIIFILCIGLLACEAKPVREDVTTNREVPVALLFEHEGCSIYRFYDDGWSHYYSVCRVGSSTVQEHQRRWMGKTSQTVYLDVPTSRVP